MAAVMHETVETLIARLKCYSGAQSKRVIQDVNNLLRQSNSIACEIDALVHNDGRSSTLLKLYGTVPIFYKSRQYNIPITIWLVEQYPALPPTCYVTPTKDMRIKPGHRHVDAMGLVYLPYLNQWNTNSSNLAELVLSMMTVFSDDPPVYRADPNDPATSAAAAGAAAAAASAAVKPKPAVAGSPASVSSAASAASNSASASEAAAQKKNKLVQTVTAKLQHALGAAYKELATDIDKLFEQSSSLRANEEKVKQTTAALKEQQTALVARVAALTAKCEEVNAWVTEHEAKGAHVDVDSIVYARDSWSAQVLDLVAEDHAIEDTLYGLDKALNEERLDQKLFLKQIRKLAAQQFHARALGLKIAEAQAKAKANAAAGGGAVGGADLALNGIGLGVRGAPPNPYAFAHVKVDA